MSDWTETVDPRPLFDIADPYYQWLFTTRFAYSPLHVGHLIPVIIEVKPRKKGGTFTARDLANGNWGPGWQNWLRIPYFYADPAEGLEGTTFCTALVTQTFFHELNTSGSALRAVIKRFQVGQPMVPGPAAAPRPPPPPPVKPGGRGTVVIGIIDDGLAFAHERFRAADGRTRVEYFWDQDERFIGGFPYGRELTKTVIDGHIGNGLHEEEIYAATQHVDYTHDGHKAVNWRVAHGTHVMDLACGWEPGTAPDRQPIVGVQLPAQSTADTSGHRLDPFVLDGVRYILERASALNGGNAPRVVVNFSYGVFAPDEHTEPLVAALDEIIRLRPVPLAISLPAGNQYLSRTHAAFRLPAGRSQTLQWQVQPESKTDSFMEIWLPQGTDPYPFQVRVEVTSPTGDTSGWMAPGDTWTWHPDTSTLCQVVYQNAASIWGRHRISIQLAPTQVESATLGAAPCGTWRIRVQNTGPAMRLEGWIQRNDTPHGYPQRGRQSYFVEDDAYQRWNEPAGPENETDSAASYLQRAGSFNRLAAGTRTIVMGGYQRKDPRLAKYTAGGPVARPSGVLPPYRNAPDAVAVTEDSKTCHGVLAAGSSSGSVVAMSGTSVAAPQATRWIARRMALGQPATRAHLAAAATPFPAPAPDPRRTGAGRLVMPALRPRPPIRRFEP